MCKSKTCTEASVEALLMLKIYVTNTGKYMHLK